MLKEIPIWKKIMILITFVIIVARIFYIMERDEIAKQHYLSEYIDTTGAKEIPCISVKQRFRPESNRLKSIEIICNGIAEDRIGEIVLSIKSGNELLYKTAIPLERLKNLEWKQIFVNMFVEQNKEYELYFDSRGCTKIPNLLTVSRSVSSPEVIYSASGNKKIDNNIAVEYGYMSNPTLFDRIISSGLWIAFFVVFVIFIIHFEYIKEKIFNIGFLLYNNNKAEEIPVIVELILCLIIISCSGLKLQKFTKIFLCLISIVSTWKLKEKWEHIAKFLDKSWKKGLMLFLCIYAAFALVGQRILIYPLNLRVSGYHFLVLLITVLWFVPIITFVLYEFIYFSCFLSYQNSRIKTLWFIIGMLVFLIFPAALNLYANNPGISSWDTGKCMVINAHNLRGMYDWHPFFYCLVLKIILTVWDSTYAVIIVQYFFWTYVMMEGLLYLRRKGIKDSFLLVISFFAGINAANFLYINTIWKDIPYALSLLWITIIITKLILDFDEYKGKWYIYLELMIALTGIYFYRKNGIVSFIIITFVMLLVLRKNVKVLISLVITVTIICIVRGPVYKYFEVETAGRSGMYIGLSQDILGVYYAGGEVSKETLQMINIMTGYTNSEYEYIPTYAMQTYDLTVEPKKFIICYIDTFFKNPITMIRAVIARQDAIWNIFAGEDARIECVNFTESVGTYGYEGWSNYYPARKYNSFYPWMKAITSYTADNQCINALEWRCGIFTMMSLIMLFGIVLEKGIGKYLAIYIPLVGHVLSILLSTGWADFRYYWPINLMNMFLMLIGLMLLRDNKKGDTL